MMPLTTSLIAHKSVWWKGSGGYGYGYGVSQITGALIVFQKEEMISDEEYRERQQGEMSRRQGESRKQQLEAALPELREAHALGTLKAYADASIDLNIVEKKALIGATKYHVVGEIFASQAEAQAHLQIVVAGINARKLEWENSRKTLAELEEELQSLR